MKSFFWALVAIASLGPATAQAPWVPAAPTITFVYGVVSCEKLVALIVVFSDGVSYPLIAGEPEFEAALPTIRKVPQNKTGLLKVKGSCGMQTRTKVPNFNPRRLVKA